MLILTIAGNLGDDAKSKTVGDDSVTEFSVASTEKRGEEKVTTWVRCSLWGRRGESLAPYLVKGAAVTVTGAARLREYQTREGDARTALECRVHDVALQGGAPAPSAASPARNKPRAPERF